MITYYAILGSGATLDHPSGLVRRLDHDDGPEDEGLRRDMSWRRTSLIVEWMRGNADDDLVVVSHEQASRIVEYLRQKYADEAEPDSGS